MHVLASSTVLYGGEIFYDYCRVMLNCLPVEDLGYTKIAKFHHSRFRQKDILNLSKLSLKQSPIRHTDTILPHQIMVPPIYGIHVHVCGSTKQ